MLINRFESGEIIFSVGSMSDGIYIILKGTVSVSVIENDDIVLVTYSEGSYIGDHFLIGVETERSYM